MPLQFKLYSIKFTNKLLPPAILPFLKLCHRGTHGASATHHPTATRKSHYATWLKSYF